MKRIPFYVFAVVALTTPVAFVNAQLGPAPRLTDTSVVPTGPTVRAAAVATSNPIDTQHRGEVVGHFFSRWWPYLSVPSGWTGSTVGCNAGDINQARKDATIASINYYRAMTGLPDTVTLSPTINAEDQQAALMMAANGQLNHSPPTSWQCYTSAGANAAGHSNLAAGMNGPDAIDGYMDDYGAGNYFAGHRRWLLYPPQAQMGTGDVDGNFLANALGVLYSFGPRPPSPAWVAWPPAGYVPYWLLPAGSDRWSFSIPGANFGNASVTMVRGATPISVVMETIETGYGDNTLVWRPQGISYAAPTQDTTYDVTISNVATATQASYSYSVTFIKPVKPPKLADFDNDGIGEAVWANVSAQQGALWFMKNGALDHPSFFSIPTGWQLRGAADIDGDGKADLVWTHAALHQLAVWFMNGSAATSSTFFGLGSGWDLAAIGDLNGDGKADFVFRNTNGQVLSWLMNGATIAQTVAYPSVDSSWVLVGTGNFSDFAKQQIVWRHVPSGTLALWNNADTPSVQSVGLGSPGGTWQVRAIGDFDGDGRSDIFWRDNGGQNAIWLSGNSATASYPPGVGTDWTPIGAGQYYGDGHSDLLWQHASGVIAQWRFNGALAPSATFLPSVPAGWMPANM